MRGRAARGWALARQRRRVVANGLPAVIAPDLALSTTSRVDQAELRARLANLEATVSPTANSTILERAIAGSPRHIGLAQIAGAKVVFHDADARKNNPGLPDILMIVGSTMYFVECKPKGEKLRPAQQEWMDALAGVKEVVFGTLYPADYEAFAKEVVGQSLADQSQETE